MSVFVNTIDYIRILFAVVMGKSGVGKTYMIRSLLEHFPGVAMCDTDGGAASIRDLSGSPNFFHADCSSPEKLVTAFRAINEEVPPDWVIYLDSFTDALVNDVAERESKGGKIKLQEWGDIAAMAGKILRMGKQRSLRRHFVMSVKEEYEQDAEGVRLWRPNLQGKATGKVFAGGVDLIWRMAVEADPAAGIRGVRYVTYTTALPDAETKFRCPPALRDQIPAVIDSTDIGKYMWLAATYGNDDVTKEGK